jgi:hypothetical protein
VAGCCECGDELSGSFATELVTTAVTNIATATKAKAVPLHATEALEEEEV